MIWLLVACAGTSDTAQAPLFASSGLCGDLRAWATNDGGSMVIELLDQPLEAPANARTYDVHDTARIRAWYAPVSDPCTDPEPAGAWTAYDGRVLLSADAHEVDVLNVTFVGTGDALAVPDLAIR